MVFLNTFPMNFLEKHWKLRYRIMGKLWYMYRISFVIILLILIYLQYFFMDLQIFAYNLITDKRKNIRTSTNTIL